MVTLASQVIQQHTSFTLDDVERIYSALREAATDNERIYDLSHITEIDTAGAQLLVSFAQSCEATYRNCSPAVVTFISDTGLNTHFPREMEEASK